MFLGKTCSNGHVRDEAGSLGPCHFLLTFSKTMLVQGRVSFISMWQKDPLLGDSTQHRGSNKRQHLVMHLQARQVSLRKNNPEEAQLGHVNCVVHRANLPPTLPPSHTHTHPLNESTRM